MSTELPLAGLEFAPLRSGARDRTLAARVKALGGVLARSAGRRTLALLGAPTERAALRTAELRRVGVLDVALLVRRSRRGARQNGAM